MNIKPKIILLLILLNLFLPQLTHAEEVKGCITHAVYKVKFINSESGLQIYTPVEKFTALTGDEVGWLGYAPRSLPSYWLFERAGRQYGYKGVNLDYVEPVGVFYLKGLWGRNLERWVLVYYPPREHYILSRTSLTPFSLPDGTALDYHVLTSEDGGNCIFWIDRKQIENNLYS